MKLFHGTTWNRFQKIKECGYLGNDSPIWDVSDPETTYFWTEKFLKEEAEDHWFDRGIQMALESADIALSQEREDLRRVVLIFDSKDFKKIGKLETDDSHENMAHCKKFVGKIPVSFIKETWIDENKLDLLGLYFIGLAKSLSKNWPSVENYWRELSSELLSAAETVYETLCEWFLEEFDSPDKLIPLVI